MAALSGLWRTLPGLLTALWLATTLWLSARTPLRAALLLSRPTWRLSLLSLLSWRGSLRLPPTELPALLAGLLLPTGLGLAALVAPLLAGLLLPTGLGLAALVAPLLAGLARLGTLLAGVLLAPSAGRLLPGTARPLPGTARLLPTLRWLVATLPALETLLAGLGRLSLLARLGWRGLLAAELASWLSRLSLLARWPLLCRLLPSVLTLLVTRLP